MLVFPWLGEKFVNLASVDGFGQAVQTGVSREHQADRLRVHGAHAGEQLGAARAGEGLGGEHQCDVDTGTGPTPTDAQQSGGLYMSCSSTATTAARKWIIAASDKFCLLLIAYSVSYPNDYSSYAFGDFPSLKSGDAYPFIVVADTDSYIGSNYIGDTNEWRIWLDIPVKLF